MFIKTSNELAQRSIVLFSKHLSASGSYKESSCTAPLLFVLSSGSDPTAALLSFAESCGYGSKISVISMGQGQGPKAAALIATARKAGELICLRAPGFIHRTYSFGQLWAANTRFVLSMSQRHLGMLFGGPC